MSNFTIVLQGPVHHNTSPAARSWAKFGRVIISTWEGEAAEALKLELPDFQIITQICPGPPPPPSIYNQQNVYLQCRSTLSGLELVDTEFVIKARGDTFIGNPEPFIISCLAFPDRYVCSNLHFRPDNIFKFHASDKFVGGRTEAIRDTFRLARERCERDAILLNSGIYDYTFQDMSCPYPLWKAGQPLVKTSMEDTPIIGVPCELPHGYVGAYPEVVLSTSYLIQKGIKPDRAISRQQMFDNFWIVKMEDCYPYSNKDGYNTPEHNWVEIHNINQL